MDKYDTISVLWISLIFNMICSLSAMFLDTSEVLVLPNEVSMVKYNLVLMAMSVAMCIIDTFCFRRGYYDEAIQKLISWIYIGIICFVGASVVWVGTTYDYYTYTIASGVIIFLTVFTFTYAVNMLSKKY